MSIVKWKKGNSKKKCKGQFLRGYKEFALFAILLLALIYVGIYWDFSRQGGWQLPSGEKLEKSDWLGFLGEYLSFAGALVVSLVAIMQVEYNNKKIELREERKREQKIQPIFSITIDGINQQVNGTVDPISIREGRRIVEHRNFTLSIKNVGKYPILHGTVFDEYIKQLFESGQTMIAQFAYTDSPDYNKWKQHLIAISTGEYERCEEGLPTWFNITYEDIDGNCKIQTFELNEFNSTKYYSLSNIEDA